MNKKIAIITGGSRGLGKSAALKLAERGADVIFTYHSRQAEADAVVVEIEHLGGKGVALSLDVGNSATFVAFAERVKAELEKNWKRSNFDYLVNNAGSGINTPFAETTEAQFDLMMNIHLKGVFFLTQHLLPMIADGGRILNVSSGLTRFTLPGYAAYATMKGAVEVLTRYLAKELGGRDIAVNVIAPGAIATDFGGGAVRDNKDLNAYIAAQTALGRVGQPDDIGGVIAALLSGDCSWIDAQRIEISGGISI
jgi:NAD(P)-dependent dehydrogenase (short-subunit alcohol dehydrogenase family)